MNCGIYYTIFFLNYQLEISFLPAVVSVFPGNTCLTRIESTRGHLSNDECSAKLLELIQEGCKKFALCHLSQENNTPALALQTVFNTLGAAGVVPEKDCIVQAQRRNEMSPVLEF